MISIIALLIALLLPALAGARRTAAGIQCLSNARQLVAASLMYANDENGKVPRPGNGLDPNRSWSDDERMYNYFSDGIPADIRDGTLWPYLRDERIYICPMDEGLLPITPPNSPRQTISYAMPMVWMYRDPVTWEFMQRRIDEQDLDPQRAALFVESGHSTSLFGAVADNGSYSPGGTFDHDSPTDRHNDNCVLGLLGGHAEMVEWHRLGRTGWDYWLFPMK